MGMFDGLLGGIVGAGMVSVVNNVLEQHGGVQGVVNQFEKNGLGSTVRSWVSTGPNQSISPEDVHRTLGPASAAVAEVRLVGRGTDREAGAGAATGGRQAHAGRHHFKGIGAQT